MDLSIPGGHFPGDFGPNPLVIAIWLGDATFGRIVAGMFINQRSEAVFSHIFKFLKKYYRQIGGIWG